MIKMLHLHLKREWFEKIASGKKVKEYREMKPYWNVRFQYPKNHEFKYVTIQLGYSGPKMVFRVVSIEEEHGLPNDLGVENVWAIYLGERVQ